MLKNNKERRQWIDNLNSNYTITVDTGSVKVLESKYLPDGSEIIVIQVFVTRGNWDYDLKQYVSSNEWQVVDRYIKLPGERTIQRKSPSELVDHLRGIKE